MNDPEREIGNVVYRLMGTNSPDVQKANLEKYFVSNLSFRHPIFQVNSGPNSRNLVLGIFQCYRILSPHGDVRVDSVTLDRLRNVVYLEMTHWYKLFFLPSFLAPAPAHFIARLKLVKINDLHYVAEHHHLYLRDEFASVLFPFTAPFVRLGLIAFAYWCNIIASVAIFLGYWRPSPTFHTTLARDPGLYSDRDD